MKTYEFEIACTATNTTDIIISNCPKEAIISFTKKNPDTIHWSKTIIDTRVISETVNSNQALIDEYRGLIEVREAQLETLENEVAQNRHNTYLSESNNSLHYQIKQEIRIYQQFITKLEGAK